MVAKNVYFATICFRPRKYARDLIFRNWQSVSGFPAAGYDEPSFHVLLKQQEIRGGFLNFDYSMCVATFVVVVLLGLL